jgi:hypothetical protein
MTSLANFLPVLNNSSILVMMLYFKLYSILTEVYIPAPSQTIEDNKLQYHSCRLFFLTHKTALHLLPLHRRKFRSNQSVFSKVIVRFLEAISQDYPDCASYQ